MSRDSITAVVDEAFAILRAHLDSVLGPVDDVTALGRRLMAENPELANRIRRELWDLSEEILRRLRP